MLRWIRRRSADSRLTEGLECGSCLEETVFRLGEPAMLENSTTQRNSALARLCQGDLLSPEEERRLFRRLKQVRTQSSRLSRPSPERKPSGRTRPPSAAIAALRNEAVAIRNRIIESNLRLVVSLAKHYAAPERPLEDLVSE